MAEPLFEIEGARGGESSPSGASGALTGPRSGTPGRAEPGTPAAVETAVQEGDGSGAPVAAASSTVVLRVHVQPAAGKATVVGRYGDSLHVRVAAPPVGGRANAATADLIADLLDLKPAQIELAGGDRSRSKRFRLSDVDPEDLGRKLDTVLENAAQRAPRGARGRAKR